MSLDYSVKEIRGMTAAHASVLAEQGCGTTATLLSACATPAQRKAVADRTGLSASQVLHYANRADLMRVSGIGTKYGDLLEAAGVDTVKEMATRRPDNLLAKLGEVNQTAKLVKALPAQADVEKWIAEAKALPPKLNY